MTGLEAIVLVFLIIFLIFWIASVISSNFQNKAFRDISREQELKKVSQQEEVIQHKSDVNIEKQIQSIQLANFNTLDDEKKNYLDQIDLNNTSEASEVVADLLIESKIVNLNNKPSRKENWSDFQNILVENKIVKFYHFTDRENIPSIKKFGLCAWGYCKQMNIEISKAGGSEGSRSLDTRDNLQNYVRVSFTKQHPMMYVAKREGRINNPVILEINTEIAFWKDTMFSDRNATRNGAVIGNTFENFKQIKFDLVKKTKHFDIDDEQERQFYQAELLILNTIPVEFISNINSFEL